MLSPRSVSARNRPKYANLLQDLTEAATLQRFFNKIFSRNYLAAAALYSGLALLLLAAVPDQSSLRALDDECGGQCEEGMVCVGNDEGGYECLCAEEE